jgi:hypothetical protein
MAVHVLVCFIENSFLKLFFKFFYIYLLLEKLVNEKYFPVKKKFDLIFTENI